MTEETQQKEQGGRFYDPNLLVQWFKNGDHPEDNCEVYGDGPFKGMKKEGRVVRYFRMPGLGDKACPKCTKDYDDHGFIEHARNANDNEAGPNYPGMVCPGDWVLKTVVTPGAERYVVKRPDEVMNLGRSSYYAAPSTPPSPDSKEEPGLIKRIIHRITGR